MIKFRLNTLRKSNSVILTKSIFSSAFRISRNLRRLLKTLKKYLKTPTELSALYLLNSKRLSRNTQNPEGPKFHIPMKPILKKRLRKYPIIP